MREEDMESEKQNRSGSSFFHNWVSLAGAMLAVSSLFAFLLLLAFDTFTPDSNPYLGILTFIVAPFFLITGLALITVGWLSFRFHGGKKDDRASPFTFAINLKRSTDRKRLYYFTCGFLGFLLLTAFGSYRTYHFTESVKFCGEVCHTVMEPEMVTYLTSPHARVACVECHIGPGTKWYVQAKLSGLYQVYSVLADAYPRPIETPVHSLRPAQDTCEQCHWPQKFTGNMERTYNHYLSDEENSPYSVRLLLKVGGGNPAKGPVTGIHWHTDPSNKIEYIATDKKRMVIPWVRMTKQDGTVTVFSKEGFELSESYEIRKMDCMDCHNRPAHKLSSPNDAVEEAIYLGQYDTSLEEIKYNAVDLLIQEYETKEEAFKSIDEGFRDTYEDFPEDVVTRAIETTQNIYQNNFYPEMNADWSVYPEHIGHKNWPGCFRCHDGKHVSQSDKHILKANDCSACHTILAQGNGEELEELSPAGLPFIHPQDEAIEGLLCSDCHNGSIQ